MARSLRYFAKRGGSTMGLASGRIGSLDSGQFSDPDALLPSQGSAMAEIFLDLLSAESGYVPQVGLAAEPQDDGPCGIAQPDRR